MSNFSDVQDLHYAKFAISNDGQHPEPLVAEQVFARATFIIEEVHELMTAHTENDLGEQIDALIDIVYVAMGVAVQMGVDWEAHWKLVHDANMTKVPGRHTDKRQNMALDLIKPEGWAAPDHHSIINNKHVL